MRHRCTNCGFKADNAVFFRREPAGLFDRKQTVCEACTPFRTTTYEKRLIFRAILVPLVFCFTLVPRLPQSWGLLSFGLILTVVMAVSLSLQIAIHEAGHALAAKAVGASVSEIRIGDGPIRKSLILGDLRVDLRRNRFGGGMVVYGTLKGPLRRIRQMIITIAGPLANILMAGLAFYIAAVVADYGEHLYVLSVLHSSGLPDDLTGRYASYGHALAVAIADNPRHAGKMPPLSTGLSIVTAILRAWATANLLAAFINLMPSETGDNAEVASDGQQLLDLLKARPAEADPDYEPVFHMARLMALHRYEEAATLATTVIWSSPYKRLLAMRFMHAASRSRGDQAALDFYLANAHRLPAEPGDLAWPWLQANIAWCAIKLGDPAYAALADDMSAQALGALPDIPETQGTRGAWLVSNGQTDKGLALLTKAARTIADTFDKGDFCTWIARAWRTKGDLDRAALYDALSRHLKSRP